MTETRYKSFKRMLAVSFFVILEVALIGCFIYF
jgi:nitrate reductase NapE component